MQMNEKKKNNSRTFVDTDQNNSLQDAETFNPKTKEIK